MTEGSILREGSSPRCKAIAVDPGLARTRASRIDPGAIGFLARNYGRGADKLGTHALDITEAGARKMRRLRAPTVGAIRDAAASAIEEMRAELMPGRTRDTSTMFLAFKLARLFGTFGPNGHSDCGRRPGYGGFHDLPTATLREAVLSMKPGYRSFP